MMPPTTQREISSNGDLKSSINNPEVVKIPAPIILAMTMLEMEKSPSLGVRNALESVFNKLWLGLITDGNTGTTGVVYCGGVIRQLFYVV